MQKKIILLLLLVLPLGVMAQEAVPAKYGYLSYSSLYSMMPEYAAAQRNMADLKEKYDKEAQRSEAEFQQKFAEFLQGQKDFPANILQKRQKELQDLMEKSIGFKQDVQRLLAEAEKELQAEVGKRLDAAIREVGLEKGYSFILNTDGNAYPFINPAEGEDATEWVKQKLQLTTEP